MLDLFTIFTKGGIVLWYFQPTASTLTSAVNALIKTVILQERGGVNVYNHDSLTLKFKLDNEFELIFVAVYQNIVKLSYIDKLLDQVCLEFRDQYKNQVSNGAYAMVNFDNIFKPLLTAYEEEARQESLKPKQMRAFQPKTDPLLLPSNQPQPEPAVEEIEDSPPESNGSDNKKASKLSKLQTRGRGSKKEPSSAPKSSPKVAPGRKPKQNTKWDGVVSKEEAASLDHSEPQGEAAAQNGQQYTTDFAPVGSMKSVQPLTVSEAATKKPESSGGIFSMFSSLGAGKTITRESMAPALEKMSEHLVTKNVAAGIAEKLCDSVAAKLEGKVIGTFTGVKSTVRSSMEESLMQILQPKRRIDILRDVEEAAGKGRPYVITFCGVNGVGKSTNLAKIAFWLLENNHRVLIAACDTFRSGAVEQLRTHTTHLSSLHPQQEGDPPRIQLFNQGYNKDAAGVAMEAIHVARNQGFNVVLVDTAGRMQDNEPLMRSLAKLIRVNCPDLVLFVGEALVGNEAVDQLDKFNRALTDHSEDGTTQIIDGILLTKFDTIDDKVGAAISMTYTTGQPIVFVGTGQRYTDLKSLNASAVVSLLLQ